MKWRDGPTHRVCRYSVHGEGLGSEPNSTVWSWQCFSSVCDTSLTYPCPFFSVRSQAIAFNVSMLSHLRFLLRLLFEQAEEPGTHCCIIAATHSVFEGPGFLDIPQGGRGAWSTQLRKSTKLFFWVTQGNRANKLLMRSQINCFNWAGKPRLRQGSCSQGGLCSFNEASPQLL